MYAPPRSAPRGRRALARLIDLLPALGLGLAAIGYRFERHRRVLDPHAPLPELPPWIERGEFAGLAALQVLGAWGRSPGCRLAGVRRVSTRSGRAVGPGRALLRVLIMHGPRLVIRWAGGRGSKEAHGQRLSALTAHSVSVMDEVRRLQEQHAGDADAFNRACEALFASGRWSDLDASRRAWATSVVRELVLGVGLGRVFAKLRDALTGETVVVEA